MKRFRDVEKKKCREKGKKKRIREEIERWRNTDIER